MPRTSRTEQDKWASHVKGRIEYYKTVRCTSHPKIAEGAAISRNRYYRRLRNPQSLTLAEISRIASFLNVSPLALISDMPQKMED